MDESEKPLLKTMVIGVALAEGIGMLGMFVITRDFSETQIAFFVISVSIMLTYAPFYIRRLSESQQMR